MTTDKNNISVFNNKPVPILALLLMIIGLGVFIFQLAGDHPDRAWQAYLINFLLWSAVAQGGLLFSAVTHVTKARWSRPLQDIAESFVAFFPISLCLFLILFAGREFLFPWLHHEFHGKESWLNMPFLFSRDLIGLLILYGLGLLYVYDALRLRIGTTLGEGGLRFLFQRKGAMDDPERKACKNRMTVLAVLYILAYTLVLTLIAFDLIMSMEPPWFSTLFGPYFFVEAFYLGLGALIILASVFFITRGDESGLTVSHFHDIGKFFFAFCLLWADFFYAQLLVIWYGNISEETHYVITRTVMLPWKTLAWTVFIVSFAVPFLVLLNKSIKSKPVPMILLCTLVFIGLWLEHILLLGPSLSPQATSLPIGPADVLISLGFLGLLVLALTSFFRLFPLPVRQPLQEVA
jgi:Ni/Fe-hydrogenase subunit HybB-like protein